MDIKDYFIVLIPSFALCITFYAFLSNNPKYREFSGKFGISAILQLISIINCSFLVLISQLNISFSSHHIICNILQISSNIITYIVILFFIIGWLYLGRVFYVIYGSIYHMRRKRFIKYSKLFTGIYEKFFHEKFYETTWRKRTSLNINTLPTNSHEKTLKNIKDGVSILLLYNSSFDIQSTLTNYIIESIDAEETVDLVTTFRSPLDIIHKISELYGDNKIPEISKKISIIDCFSPYYAFDDKVLKLDKKNYTKKGLKFYEADSFASIHTAANSSWYRFRNELKKIEGNTYRIPHRTIYDTLSSLIRFSSEEQYFLFLRHVINSEKSYGMISLIIEPSTLNPNIKEELMCMVDIVIESNLEE